MNALLLAALGIHLVTCALAVGTLCMLLLAGPPPGRAMRRWEKRSLQIVRWSVVVALGSGVLWLLARTALFEGRSDAALEAAAVWRAAIDTWPGRVWLVRHGLLLLLAAFLVIRGDVSARRDWYAARSQAFIMAALVLTLLAGSSHTAALSEGGWTVANDMLHLLGAGVWVGGLPALALLLYAASRDDPAPSAYAVAAARRFSRLALCAVLTLAATGLFGALLLVETLAGLVGTTHGRLLLAKFGLLVPILLLAAINRALLASLDAGRTQRSSPARRMAMYVALEFGLAVGLLGIAATMTVTTPARHGNPMWPWSVRLPPNFFAAAAGSPDVPLLLGVVAPAALGVALLVLAAFASRRRGLLLACVGALLGGAAAIGLRPFTIEAFPTSYLRPPIAFHASSIAEGMVVYKHDCATCHEPSPFPPGATGAPGVDLRGAQAAQRSAGDLYWLVSHGRPERGMPDFANCLNESERWNVINFVRALEFSADQRQVGSEVEQDRAWLPAPDFTFSVGPLAPKSLRDYRGQWLVLLVLYALPELSRADVGACATLRRFVGARCRDHCGLGRGRRRRDRRSRLAAAHPVPCSD